MENTIEIQKEFEILVSELERLKSINELTSSNANSAKTVINEIDKIADAAKQIHASVELDFLQKNEKINELLAELSETISNIEKTAKASQFDLQKKVDELTSTSNNLVEKNRETLSNAFEKIYTSLDNNKAKISSQLEDLFSNAITSQKETFNSYIQEINELHKKSTSTFLNSSNRFVNLIEILSTEIKNNSTLVQNDFQQVIVSLNSHITENKKFVDDGVNKINAILNDRCRELNELMEQNRRMSKRNRIILIASSVLTIGILIFVLLNNVI